MAISSRNLDEKSYFDGIKEGQWQDEVLQYRAGKKEKKSLTSITASGVFKERKADKLIEHSGFICIDIDAKDQICEVNIDAIKHDKFTYAVHKSAGGFGYAVFVRIDKQKHLDSFLGLEHYYFVNYSIVIDKSCKDTSRLRFVSYDPDIYINDKSVVFNVFLKKKEAKIQQQTFVVIKSDFDEMVNSASSMNLFDEYSDYIKLGFALASEFGENGRAYFHSLCSDSSKYSPEKTDSDYDKVLKRKGHGVTIASVYFKFKEAGISLTSEKTEQIKSIAKLSDTPEISLRELGIDDSENIAVLLKPKKNQEKTDIDLVIDLIKLNKVVFNEITRNFEFNGEPMNDRLLAKFYTQVWQRIDEDFPTQKIFTLIQNRDNSTSYNPIRKWFDQNKHIETDNEFDKLKACFEIDHKVFVEDVEHNLSDYLDMYLKKWLLGLIGSAFGTYSLMILVLNGEQNTNKTEFFRNLLPLKLRSFYSENNLDDGKDSEILMTKKWLIIDDEFGGKSKKDSTKLKRLSSQQTFSIRMPFGRVSEDLQRLAVLGGTSNDSEVINDPTGNRRIIPINIISLDIDAYKKIDKDKLFIELYKIWEADKDGWFLTKNEIEWLNKSTLKNKETMAEVELLDKHFEFYELGEMTNTDVRYQLERMFLTLKTNSKRVGQALKLCGFEQIMKKKNGKMFRSYQIISISDKSVNPLPF